MTVEHFEKEEGDAMTRMTEEEMERVLELIRGDASHPWNDENFQMQGV